VGRPRGKYDKPELQRQLYRKVIEHIDAVPGVERRPPLS
jgi:hypothetical protein